LTPEWDVAGITDFRPGRLKLFGNSSDEYLKVHDRGRSLTDVTEGLERTFAHSSQYYFGNSIFDLPSGK
jgi:hypothetical protein